jgi:hypothetical protein
MDGRANYDIDRASVLCTADDLEEAFNDLNDYGEDTCIIRVTEDTQELVYSLLWDPETSLPRKKMIRIFKMQDEAYRFRYG